MKRFACILLALLPLSLAAQNIQYHWDFMKERNYPTVTIEMFRPDNYGSTFFFVDMDFADFKDMSLAYLEISRNQKINQSCPILAHLEYNGGLFAGPNFGGQIHNAWLLGAAYPFSVNAANFELQANYKHILRSGKEANLQLTGVWDMPIAGTKLSFSGFIDVWSEKTFFSKDRVLVLLTEPQLWYNFNKNLALGSEVEISNNFVDDEIHIFPTFGAKWTF